MSNTNSTTFEDREPNPIVCATCYSALTVRHEQFSTYVEPCAWCRERAMQEATHQGRLQGLEQCERIIESTFDKAGAR